MRGRYPEIEPYERGMLDVGDGNLVYWEACGNPAGRPALVLHGGPGGGCSAGLRRYLSPDAYRIILFDQRGCGRNTPDAGDPNTDLAVNTTWHLVGDMEKLRERLGVDRWLLFGGSWGCVLGLVYAERYPERVSGAVFMGVATGRRAETTLLTTGLRPVFPAAWERYAAGVPAGTPLDGMAAAYRDRLADPDPEVRATAAREWCEWEAAIVPTVPDQERFADPDYRMCFARIVTHYWSNGSWLDEGAVLADAGSLAGIPGVLVQGVLDLINLGGTPWELAKAWPDAELIMIGDAGHDTRSAKLVETLVAATDRVWFWEVLADCSPRVAGLTAWLAAQSRETVAHFGHVYEDLALELADRSAGIDRDVAADRDGDGGWSEDDLDDLCRWIVSQGKAFWTEVKSGRYSMVDAARRYLRRSSSIGGELVEWDTAVDDLPDQSRCAPEYAASAVYRSRFGEILD